MGKISLFCSWRALLHPYGVSVVPSSPRGAWGTPPGGEVQTLPGEQGLAQGAHLEWHHLPRAGLCPQPAQSLAQERSSPRRSSSRRAASPGCRAQIPAGCTLHSGSPAPCQPWIWALQPQELLPSPGRAEQGRAEQQLLCQARAATHWCHFLGNKRSFAGQKQKLK